MRAAPGTVKLEYGNVGGLMAEHFRQQRRVLGPLQYGVEPDETTGRQAACQGLTQTGAVFDERGRPPVFAPEEASTTETCSLPRESSSITQTKSAPWGQVAWVPSFQAR